MLLFISFFLLALGARAPSFFSSRRRPTTWPRDWSSDVCSSDLAAPGRPSLEQLRARHAQQQDGRVTREVGDMLDEIEQRLLRPVQVVEYADERALLRRLLEKLSERPRNFVG